MRLDDNLTTIIVFLIVYGFLALMVITLSGWGWLIPFLIGVVTGWMGKKFYDKKKKM